jgi:hypothetical protein
MNLRAEGVSVLKGGTSRLTRSATTSVRYRRPAAEFGADTFDRRVGNRVRDDLRVNCQSSARLDDPFQRPKRFKLTLLLESFWVEKLCPFGKAA